MRALLLLLGFFLPLTLPAQQTAYQALRTATEGKSANLSALLCGVEGLHGTTQPRVWRFVFADPSARHGFREMEVAGGQVVTERTPVNSPFENEKPILLERLQVDSDSAFTAAENEAIRAEIGFNSADYLLQTADNSRHPVWRVRLRNGADRIVATYYINGANAQVLNASGRTHTGEESDSPELKIHRALKKTGQTISDGAKRVGGSVQEVFTGERTIDKNVGAD